MMSKPEETGGDYVHWLKGHDTFAFSRPLIFQTFGRRGSGKSALLEHIAEQYLMNGCCVFDLYSARDAESLAWLRNPLVKDKRILILKGENVDVTGSYDIKKTTDFTLGDLERYDVIISSPPLYSTPNEEWAEVGRLVEKFYRRLHWKRVTFCVIREAGHLLYSRMSLGEKLQTEAKSKTAYFIEESRHSGFGFGLDSQRYLSTDINVRSLADYLFIKAQGNQEFPSGMDYVCRYVDPEWLRRMKPQCFALVTYQSNIGVGRFTYPKWHKEEGEDIIEEVGIKIEYGEESEVERGVNRGTFTTVGDAEHVKIVELKASGLSMKKTGDELHRSSGTVHGQVNRHNAAIDRAGFCAACRRAGGTHAEEQV